MMFGLSSKIAAGLGFACLIILVYAMSLRADIAELKGREELHLRNAATLQGVIDTQKTSAETMSKQSEANLNRITEYETDQKATAKETRDMLGKINVLRATEERNALMAPYKRGLAAGDRLNHIMQRFGTSSDTRLPSGDNTNGNKANDPSRTKPEGSEGTGSNSNNS